MDLNINTILISVLILILLIWCHKKVAERFTLMDIVKTLPWDQEPQDNTQNHVTLRPDGSLLYYSRVPPYTLGDTDEYKLKGCHSIKCPRMYSGPNIHCWQCRDQI